MPPRHRELHHSGDIGWLRAAVLGANDGLISTASLVVGVASAGAPRNAVLVSAIAGLVAGALSMAAGEYVSVASQADTQRADLDLERRELAFNEPAERAELAAIYVARGLTPALADQVSQQLMAQDALGAHARDELGMSATTNARPLQAALASAVAFAAGAGFPVLLSAVTPLDLLTKVIMGSAMLLLALLGGLAARTGGAPVLSGAVRVMFWGALAMAVTALVGSLFGARL
ncbi:MAG: VIT family protein [Anaerolineae bacterium]|nr:VIT family protein [Gemmatimonadaceae bacterium]